MQCFVTHHNMIRKILAFGATRTANFTNKYQCQYLKLTKLIGLIRILFSFLNPAVLKLLYIFIFRPYLKYCIPVSFPLLKKDIMALGRIQHRMTWLIPGLASLTHEKTLAVMNRPSLISRRHSGDMIEVFKIFKECLQYVSDHLLPLDVTSGPFMKGILFGDVWNYLRMTTNYDVYKSISPRTVLAHSRLNKKLKVTCCCEDIVF